MDALALEKILRVMSVFLLSFCLCEESDTMDYLLIKGVGVW